MTTQAPESIEFDGKHYVLGSNQLPLESLFRKQGRQSVWYRIKANLLFDGKIQRPDFNNITERICSGCWRGYIGRWVVVDGMLILREIRDPCSSLNLIDFVFPDCAHPVKATWFSGKLSLFGEYEDLRISTYLRLKASKQGITPIKNEEKEKFFLSIRRGILTNVVTINNDIHTKHNIIT